ncbi:hypothetical protein AM571_CH00639 [Rhizobium etli 8C-3]|uniref:Uncharacterized protein n=1 Tax=Rhizobium etli 8C-3 TaxID=538025 RepID=A0A1L5P017_RHIET|nr:hypothetical protein AM571_CH00639 [Rhizobium etli 8C-3]
MQRAGGVALSFSSSECGFPRAFRNPVSRLMQILAPNPRSVRELSSSVNVNDIDANIGASVDRMASCTSNADSNDAEVRKPAVHSGPLTACSTGKNTHD